MTAPMVPSSAAAGLSRHAAWHGRYRLDAWMSAFSLLLTVVAVLSGVLVPVLLVLQGTMVDPVQRNELRGLLAGVTLLAAVELLAAVQLRGRLLARRLEGHVEPITEDEWFRDGTS